MTSSRDRSTHFRTIKVLLIPVRFAPAFSRSIRSAGSSTENWVLGMSRSATEANTITPNRLRTHKKTQ